MRSIILTVLLPVLSSTITLSMTLSLLSLLSLLSASRGLAQTEPVSAAVRDARSIAQAPTTPATPTTPAAPNVTTASNVVRPYSAEPAPEWDALFDRTSGWTGADGAYAIPLSGDERPGSGMNTRTFWTFNDTFVGNVNQNDDRIGAKIVRNTNAWMLGGTPDPNQVEFFFRQGRSGDPMAWFMPNTQSTHWFWLNDGVVANNKIYLFALRMKPLRDVAGDGIFDYAYDGISLLSDNLLLRNNQPNPEPLKTYQQVNTPLYVPSRCDRGSTIFGQAVLANTAMSGNPRPDGYIYIYGVRNDLDNKKLLVARVLPEQIEDFTMYQYWNGQQWTPMIEAAQPISDRLSSEFSVTPLPDGRFIMVFQLDDFLSQTVAVRYANSPTGPWSEPIPIWDTHDKDVRLHTFTYGAKAHPHLSQPGELLISYQVNTFKNSEQYDRADIYRPRFLRLSLTPDPEPPTAVQRRGSENQVKRANADRLVAQANQQYKASQTIVPNQSQPDPTAQLQAALTGYQQAVQIYDQIGDRAIAATTLNKLGEVYLKLGQFPEAMAAYERAAGIHQEIHNRVQEGISLDGLGQVYDSQQLYVQALQYYDLALPIRREVSDRCGEALTLSRMGQVYAKQNQLEPALAALQEALPIHQEVKNRPWEAMTLRDLGDLYAKTGELADARKYYRQAMVVYRELGDRKEEEATQQRLETARRQ